MNFESYIFALTKLFLLNNGGAFLLQDPKRGKRIEIGKLLLMTYLEDRKTIVKINRNEPLNVYLQVRLKNELDPEGIHLEWNLISEYITDIIIRKFEYIPTIEQYFFPEGKFLTDRKLSLKNNSLFRKISKHASTTDCYDGTLCIQINLAHIPNQLIDPDTKLFFKVLNQIFDNHNIKNRFNLKKEKINDILMQLWLQLDHRPKQTYLLINNTLKCNILSEFC